MEFETNPQIGFARLNELSIGTWGYVKANEEMALFTIIRLPTEEEGDDLPILLLEKANISIQYYNRSERALNRPGTRGGCLV